MNRQIARLFTAFALAFALLIGFTGYWQIWAEDSLKAHRDNLTEVVHQLSIKRGLISRGVPGDKIEVIHSGTDTERFHPGVDRLRVRRELGPADGTSSGGA